MRLRSVLFLVSLKASGHVRYRARILVVWWCIFRTDSVVEGGMAKPARPAQRCKPHSLVAKRQSQEIGGRAAGALLMKVLRGTSRRASTAK